MKATLSGLLNIEVTTRTRGFPISYHLIDYPFYGVNMYPGGVGYNVAKALKALGDEVNLYSFIGEDDGGKILKGHLKELGISSRHVYAILPQTAMSTILYDESGRRLIYCDLKDLQMRVFPEREIELSDSDIVIATNINFSRCLLPLAKKAGKKIATDVQVLSDPDDEFNQEFMKYADILFLSDALVSGNPEDFILELEKRYKNEIIVMGRGGEGSLMYLRDKKTFISQKAYDMGEIKNTVGAGDAFFSAFLHFLCAEESPEKSLALASIFAGYKVTSDGASNGFVSEKKVREAYERLG